MDVPPLSLTEQKQNQSNYFCTWGERSKVSAHLQLLALDTTDHGWNLYVEMDLNLQGHKKTIAKLAF